ncbi:FAD-dependent oxidoreductase [Protaetiibacter mangrovi]|uniref:Oxidoreductase n=1 Tax=Protaetiibacter mangrovi TaxID=2970926 RepID=A0ABT1ZDG9_9MICO|nr:oxidoreductase [Protaetiibacter mangrovi]MCS0498745.1 oxidoreductase [Protaetiibacter mangrovi]TPX03420.1 oxidoreductase [Schumannella luteola]
MIAAVDRLLGRITMYLLVLGILLVLALLALVLSLAGVMPFAPLALLESAAVLLAASWIANQALGLMVRSRPLTESGLITAMLLFFVLEPASDASGLLVLALAAAIAAASKYLLAWRGRHLVNPAALAAVVIGVSGLGLSSWWVATGPMLPAVAIGALLVLWRTRRIGMGLLYVVVTGGVLAARFLSFGGDLGSALSFALLSSPVVFAAGFMLSEPLTLPPRRWQRLAYSLLVALLTSVPFAVGPFLNTPELALVIGGAAAFAFGQRRAVVLEFLGSRQLTPTAWEFRFRPRVPLRFAPGQYLELTLPHRRHDLGGIRRVFSLTSVPGADEVTVGVRIREHASSFKTALRSLEPGTRVRATGVWGDFTLPRDPEARLAFVAAGIGVTPFVSQLAALAAAGRSADAELLYAVRAASDLAYREELAATGARVAVLSPDDPGELPPHWSWLGSDALTAEVVHRAIPDARERTVYLSGSPTDVSRLRRALRAAGTRRIRTDVFLGY